MEGKEEVGERAPRLGRQRSLQYYWGPRGLLLFRDGVSDKEHRKYDNRRSKDDSCVVRSGRLTARKSEGAEAVITALMSEEGESASLPSSSLSWMSSLASSSWTSSLASLPSSSLSSSSPSSLWSLMDNKSTAGEPVMREGGGGILSSGSSTSRLLMSLLSSAATCREVTERRRSDADHTSSRLPVPAIIDGLLELLQRTTEQRRQVARLIRSIDPSINIAVEELWHHHDHEYAHHRRHHHYEADHQEEEEEAEEEASKTCSIASDSSNSSQYALFLMQRVSQLRRQVALLTHELLATKARNRLLQDQLQYFLTHTASSSSSTIDPHLQPPLLVDEIKDSPSG